MLRLAKTNADVYVELKLPLRFWGKENEARAMDRHLSTHWWTYYWGNLPICDPPHVSWVDNDYGGQRGLCTISLAQPHARIMHWSVEKSYSVTRRKGFCGKHDTLVEKYPYDLLTEMARELSDE